MNQLIQTIFNDEITQQGLEDLQKKYPVGLKLKMKDDAIFKDARKTRTEMNKLVEAINRRRLDVTGELKVYADEVIAEINRIYSVVTIPFLKEDSRRKLEAERVKNERIELLEAESKRINAILENIDNCRGKDSNHIQGIIEAVDLIETDVFDKELIHQAIDVKKTTLAGLAQLLSDTIASEKVEAEREVLRKQKAEADEKQRQAEAAQKITERMIALKMIPTEFFGQPSEKIQSKINSLENFEITNEAFGDKVEEVVQSKVVVIDQLSKMLKSQLRDEAAEQEEADKLKAEEEQKAKDLEEASKGPENFIAVGTNFSKEQPTHQETNNIIESVSEEATQDVMQQDPEAVEQPQDDLPTLISAIADWADRYQLPLIATQELDEILQQYEVYQVKA